MMIKFREIGYKNIDFGEMHISYYINIDYG